MKEVTVYLVRHGETYFNIFDEFQGWSDTPLTAHGQQQLAITARILQPLIFSKIYTSDTARAMTSAAQIQQINQWQLPVISWADLREHFYGAFEGKNVTATWQLIAQSHQYRDYADLVAHYSVDTAQDFLAAVDPAQLAETSAQFWTRFLSGLQRIFHENQSDRPVLLISHSANIRALIARFAPDQLSPLNPENSKITKVRLTMTPTLTIKVVSYNQQSQRVIKGD